MQIFRIWFKKFYEFPSRFFCRTIKVASMQWLAAVSLYILARNLTESLVELELVDVSSEILENKKRF
jgi:hypothetical protein